MKFDDKVNAGSDTCNNVDDDGLGVTTWSTITFICRMANRTSRILELNGKRGPLTEIADKNVDICFELYHEVKALVAHVTPGDKPVNVVWLPRPSNRKCRGGGGGGGAGNHSEREYKQSKCSKVGEGRFELHRKGIESGYLRTKNRENKRQEACAAESGCTWVNLYRIVPPWTI